MFIKTSNNEIAFKQVVADNKTLESDVVQVLFFNLFFKLSYDNFGVDLKSFKEKNLNNEDFQAENDLVNAVLKGSLVEINRTSEGLKSRYGTSPGKTCLILAEIMQTNAKLKIVYNILGQINTCYVEFNELETKFNVSFDELELLLYEGQKRSLFRLVIDYNSLKVRVKYIRRATYTQDNLNSLRSKVSLLKDKLITMYNSLEQISN
jgi:hypothetical protein